MRWVPLLLWCVTAQAAENVTLAWDPSPGPTVSGYRLHYGTASGVYTEVKDVGNSTMATVYALVPGLTYYIVVTAYNSVGESLPSNEVSFAVTTAQAGLTAQPSNGGIQVTVTDSPGITDSVYASDDLDSWTLLTSAVNSTGTLVIEDPVGPNRFYQAINNTGTSDPVGVVSLPIAASGLSFLAISLLNPVSYQGTITSFGSYSVTDGNANWATDQFDGTNGPFFLEITSGLYAGLMTDIVVTGSDTLTTADDLSSVLSGGESYKIREHRTLGGVFGLNDQSGLTGGATASESDEVIVLDPTSQSYSIYYYKTSGLGGTGWRSAANVAADAAETKLPPGQGVIVLHQTTGNLSLVLTGTVKTGSIMVQVKPALNLLAMAYPEASMTLGSSGLYTGNSQTGLAGGTSTTADQILIFNPDTGEYNAYYYQTTGLGGTGWRSVSSNSVDASNTVLPGAFFLNRTGSSFFWTLPEPY